MNFQLITKDNYFDRFVDKDRPWKEDYLAMYSSQWQGITKDPDLMMLPIDDHLVHRGDGAFDVMRCINGKVYLMQEHLERLERSAKAISLTMPAEYIHIKDILIELIALAGQRDCLIRIVISRGPGSFSANPYDCPSSQLYINVIRFKALADICYKNGISLLTSKIPVKNAFFANIKSCNYLPNVLMKMEAVQAGCQYSVALDESGFLTEGSVENIAVLDKAGILRLPEAHRTLAGTTAIRVFQLARILVDEKMIEDIQVGNITPEEAYQAREIFLTGTSINLLPVTNYDGRVIGEGFPGPVCKRLSGLLHADMTQNNEKLTSLINPNVGGNVIN